MLKKLIELNTKKILIFVTLLFITINLFFFNYQRFQLTKDVYSINGEKLFLNSIKREIGEIQDISFIQAVINDSMNIKKANNYVLIYNDDQCPSCIVLGKKYLDKVESSQNGIFFINLSKQENKVILEGDNQINSQINRLNHINKPIILKFNKKYDVLDIFFPGIQNIKE